MLGEALRLAETIPNVMDKRLHQAQARAGRRAAVRVLTRADAHFIGA